MIRLTSPKPIDSTIYNMVESLIGLKVLPGPIVKIEHTYSNKARAVWTVVVRTRNEVN